MVSFVLRYDHGRGKKVIHSTYRADPKCLFEECYWILQQTVFHFSGLSNPDRFSESDPSSRKLFFQPFRVMLASSGGQDPLDTVTRSAKSNSLCPGIVVEKALASNRKLRWFSMKSWISKFFNSRILDFFFSNFKIFKFQVSQILKFQNSNLQKF